MSRLADAYRKSGHLPFADGASDCPTDRSTGATIWTTTSEPWNVEDSTPSTQAELVNQATEPIRRSTRARDRTAAVDIDNCSSEQLTPVVERILGTASSDKPLQSVLFVTVGATHSVGVCIATSLALAEQRDRTVCLVDADFRSPSLHVAFGIDGMPGFSDLLCHGGNARAYLTKVSENVWLLPAGASCADAVALSRGEAPSRCLTELRRAFDYVLLDTALSRSETFPLGSAIDGVVLVLDANATRREVAKRLVGELNAAKITVLGAVLTNRSFPIPDIVYHRL
jgi:Mrp family chromosome partitioning ATPase